MSFDTYTNLVAEITNWLKRDDIAANIPSFLTLAETKMNRELLGMNPPHHLLESTQTGTLSASPLTLPAGYRGTKRFRILQSGNYHVLTYKTPAQMAVYQEGGNPRYYTIINGALEVAPAPDSSYSYEWIFYAPLASLASTGTSTLLTLAPDAYLYGALLQSAPFLKADARLETWAALYKDVMEALALDNRRFLQSGSPLQIRSDSAL